MKIKTKKGKSTRIKILETATKLFNSYGTRNVTTHDIANAAGISPGNLYYYFKNKEEIVAAIFRRMDLFSPQGWREAISGEGSFYKFLDFFFSQLQKYRFFLREQADLIRSDANLAAIWRRSHSELTSVMYEAVHHWVDLGMMKKFDSQEEVDAFIDNSWIIASFSYSYFEERGEKRPTTLETAMNRQLANFLRPYHTDEGKKMLDLYFKR